jgi:transcription elongation factor Elf1
MGTTEQPVVYRRRYTCPHCDAKGKFSNVDRNDPRRCCPRCGGMFYLQEQTQDGKYPKQAELKLVV